MALSPQQKEYSHRQPEERQATTAPLSPERPSNQLLETNAVQMQEYTAAAQQETSATQARRTRQPQRSHSAPPVRIVQDGLTLKIEKVMEDGLADAFREMTSLQQQEFKIKGEQTAQAIRDLMRSAKVKVKKIFDLLVSWLKLIPGVNRFFIEQEAKIKADRICSLKLQDISLT